MRTTHLRLLMVALLAASAALISACGDDDAGSETDAQALLERTFGADSDVRSGVLDISLDAGVSGSSGGSLVATLSGPFESREETQFPLLDVEIELEAEGADEQTSFQGGLIVTGDAAYVVAEGESYEVDSATFGALESFYAQSVEAQNEQGEQGSAIFEQLGISPADWLTDVSNEGTEEIEGVETVHISGTADIARIVEDAETLSEGAGGAAGLDSGTTSELAESVERATVDVYTGAEDSILRRLDLSLELKEPGGSETITVELQIGINGVNETQEFVAPENAKPLEELVPGGVGAFGGLDALGGVDGSGGASSGGAGAEQGSGGAPLPGASPEYLECLQGATTPEEITGCASLL